MKKLLLTVVTVLIFASVARADSLTNGLIAYYPFEGNANNASGGGFNGAVIGAQLTTNRFGAANSAYNFNGVGNYIYVGDQLPDSQEFTVSMWIRSDQDKHAGLFYEAAYFTSGRDTILETFPSLELRGTSTKIADPGPPSLVASGAITLGVWKQIVWVIKTNGTAMYVNGIQVATITNAGNNIGFHSPIYIGAQNHGLQVEYFFNGSIDDVRIYNRALTPPELNRLYAKESGVSQLSIQTAAVRLSWYAISNSTYQLQWTTNFQTWSNLTSVLGADNDTNVVDWVDGTGRFYRLVTP